MRRKLLFGLLAALALAVTWFARPRFLRRSYVVIHNASGGDLSEVEIVVREERGPYEHRGLGEYRQSTDRLQTGGELRTRHGWTDSNLRMRFLLDGSERHYQEKVDLWTGEGWRVEIGPGGAVHSGYDRAGHVLVERARSVSSPTATPRREQKTP